MIQFCDTMELSFFEGKSDLLILIAHKINEVSLENDILKREKSTKSFPIQRNVNLIKYPWLFLLTDIN